MGTIQFGTDGWRAVIAEDFTFANLAKVAQATAEVWKHQRIDGTQKKVIVGYDRRFLSADFARTTAEVFAGNGFEVILSREAVPTPAVSYHVKTSRAIGGVMITASHNPPKFNGFKIKAHFGGSADSTLCRKVEAKMDRSPVKFTAPRNQNIKIKDLTKTYFKALVKLVDFDCIAKSQTKFAHDALYGVGAGCFDQILAGTRCQVTTLRGEPNPGFGGIHPEPIPSNYEASSVYLKQHPHDLCLVTDGDADRIGGMDGKGNPLTTHQIICLLLRHFVVNRRGSGRVVKALTTTSMVDKMCAAFGLPLVETGVGFKYICAEMLRGNVLLGFEESGGIGFPRHIPERDGILAGLMLLEMLAMEKKPLPALLTQLETEYGTHRYARMDEPFPSGKMQELMAFCAENPPKSLLGSPLAEVKFFDGVKYIAQSGAWLMLRGSGTEPVLRIYAEADSDANARKLLQAGRRMTKSV